jgi:hypothetical protein
MTVTIASTSGAGFNPEDDDNEIDNLPSTEEQAEALEVQLGLSSYDPSTDPLLAEELPRLLAEKGVDPLVQANVLAAVGKKSFPLSLQYEILGTAEVRTLGDLAASRSNEHAQQFLYPTAIKKILFGKYGIAKGRKLSSNIEVTYRRDRETGEPTDMVITSGRHRVTAIIALLQFLGINKWADQKVMVICKVVDSDAAFAQLIETANDSRKMPRAELQVHGLTKSGVRTARPEEFYATRTNATASQYAHLFAKAVQFDMAGQPQVVQDSVVSMVGSAWNKVFNVCPENRTSMKLLISGAQQEQQLRDAARFIAENAMSFISDAPNQFPNDRVGVGAPKVCAIALAKQLKLTAPTY